MYVRPYTTLQQIIQHQKFNYYYCHQTATAVLVRHNTTIANNITINTTATHTQLNSKRFNNNIADLNNKYTLQYFISQSNPKDQINNIDQLDTLPTPHDTTQAINTNATQSLSYWIETHGCQMNTADTETICSILDTAGHQRVYDVTHANIMLINTCAIRDGAENKVKHRINYMKSIKQPKRSKFNHNHHDNTLQRPIIVVLGCMAERMKTQLLESDKLVDIVSGPDSYRSLPQLINLVCTTQLQYSNTQLSMDESYGDIRPVRSADKYNVCAYTSITRGCNNLCSYCIVPYTRGVERSRNIDTILDEIKQLVDDGYREVTLLGQNVTSYNYIPDMQLRKLNNDKLALAPGFINISRRPELNISFTNLLDKISLIDPELRIRFTSPHPKDTSVELIQLIAERHNICKQFHLPVQSGSTTVLQRMRRGYSRDAYIDLVDSMKRIIGSSLSLSTDIISGFCGETDTEHNDTISMIEYVQYDSAFMFAYNERPRTHAYHKLSDDVPSDIKQQRLQHVIDTFHLTLQSRNELLIDSAQLLLIDNIHDSTKNKLKFSGKLDNGRRCFIDQCQLPILSTNHTQYNTSRIPTFGDYIAVKITNATALSCNAIPLGITRLDEFYSMYNNIERLTQQINLQQLQSRSIQL